MYLRHYFDNYSHTKSLARVSSSELELDVISSDIHT
jgi:hypothetical protein